VSLLSFSFVGELKAREQMDDKRARNLEKG
jgi:hypothetical protein